MKLFKTLVFLTLSVVILTSLTHCKSSKETKSMEETEHSEEKEQDQADHSEEVEHVEPSRGGGKQMPLFIRDTYFENGVTGFNIYFPTLVNTSNYKLDKVYFRGMIGEMISGKASYFAILKSKKVDLEMSNDDKAEYGNTIPTKLEPFPFELKDNECMISYMDNGKVQYFQVYNIVKKKSEYKTTTPQKLYKD